MSTGFSQAEGCLSAHSLSVVQWVSSTVSGSEDIALFFSWAHILFIWLSARQLCSGFSDPLISGKGPLTNTVLRLSSGVLRIPPWLWVSLFSPAYVPVTFLSFMKELTLLLPAGGTATTLKFNAREKQHPLKPQRQGPISSVSQPDSRQSLWETSWQLRQGKMGQKGDVSTSSATYWLCDLKSH